MAVRTRYRVVAGISSDPTNEEKDLGSRDSEVLSDGLGEGGTWKTVLPGATGDTLIQLTQVASAKFIVIRTMSNDPVQPPGSITVKKGSPAGEAWTITPLPRSKEGHMLISTDGIAALYVANPGTVPMSVIVSMSGD